MNRLISHAILLNPKPFLFRILTAKKSRQVTTFSTWWNYLTTSFAVPIPTLPSMACIMKQILAHWLLDFITMTILPFSFSMCRFVCDKSAAITAEILEGKDFFRWNHIYQLKHVRTLTLHVMELKTKMSHLISSLLWTSRSN